MAKIVLFSVVLFAVLAWLLFFTSKETKTKLATWTGRLLIPAVITLAIVAGMLAIILNTNIKVI